MPVFPLCTQQVERGCVYLRRNEIHQQLSERLKRSIMVIAHGDNIDGGGSITMVQHYLATTHLRRYYEFPALKHSHNTFLVELPSELNQEEVIEAANLWGFHTEWYFQPFDVNEDSGFEPKCFRVHLQITKFPLDFWHRSFISQAISEFGEVLHIEEQYIEGHDRTQLLLLITCIDPKRIPFSTTLPYGKRWKEMHIQIIGWEYSQWVPDDARLTAAEQRDLATVTGRTPLFPRIALIAAQDKIQRFYNTPHSPTPPASPSYFSEDATGDDEKEELHSTDDSTKNPNTAGDKESYQEPLLHHILGLTRDISENGTKPVCWGPPHTKTTETGTTNTKIEPWSPFVETNQKGFINVGTIPISVDDNIKICTVQIGEIHLLIQDPLVKTWAHSEGHAYWSKGKEKGLPKKETQTGPKTAYRGNASILGSPPGSEERPNITLKAQRNTANHLTGIKSLPTHIYEPQKDIKSPFQNTPLSTQLPITNPNQINLLSPQVASITNMAMSDEEFLQQFASLNPSEEGEAPLQLGQTAFETKDWSTCALLRIVSDRSPMLSQFSKQMVRAWEASPHTSFTVVAKNMYLIHFSTETELLRILNRGIWTYRNDIVILKRLNGPADLTYPTVDNMEIWVQIHRAPTGAFTKEGILQMINTIGTPMSRVSESLSFGQKIYRAKILLPIDKEMKDHLDIAHPQRGTVRVYLVYERLTTICLFCAKMGHDEEHCADHIRLQRLQFDPRFASRPELNRVGQPKARAWINDPAQVPEIEGNPNPSPTPADPNPSARRGLHPNPSPTPADPNPSASRGLNPNPYAPLHPSNNNIFPQYSPTQIQNPNPYNTTTGQNFSHNPMTSTSDPNQHHNPQPSDPLQQQGTFLGNANLLLQLDQPGQSRVVKRRITETSEEDSSPDAI